ncbi:response regulator [Paludibacterium purpuratum]|uniref:Response regulator receiver domain-containing protein n=1 Tax=Paludibacterium purpuratum TaxID=1144873 RepID=A0A4R7B6P7_9NEIS|nr:response regulator [Paludibacterium purpuratum]TDR80384.1 response regulator receiver domain-containing protein [Paludibacterium purpuratum]
MADKPQSQTPVIQSAQLGVTAEAGHREEAYRNSFGGRLFLVVDSVPEMQRAMGMTLSSFGAEKVEYANRASDALSKMGRYDFDVILCDYDLGNGYDGLYLFEEVKERNLIKQSCVFMIVTGERRSQRVISAAELAPDDYLLKPFSGEMLSQRLSKAMRKRTAFRPIDEAILRNEYLAAIEICNRKIAERGEFTLDFMKIKGSLSLRIGDFDTARSLYMEVLRLKDVPWAKLGLAKALTGLKSHDEARMLFEEVLADNDRIMEAYDWLARLHRDGGDLVRAQALLQKATDLSPVVIRRQKQLAEVAFMNNDLPVAEFACSETLEIAKYTWHRSPNHYAMLARVQLAQGETGNASRTLGRLRRDFRYNQAGEWMADVIDSQVQVHSGNGVRAEQLLKDAETRFEVLVDGLDAEAQMEFARACYAQHKTQLGDRVMRDLVRNHHDDESMLARLGTLFDEVGRGDAGRQLIAENVQGVVDMNNLAVKDAQSGAYEAAIERFARALTEMPSNIQIMLNLVNATMAYVHRNGWHESYMRRASELLMKVREVAPTNNKFQKQMQSWRLLTEKLGKPHWGL